MQTTWPPKLFLYLFQAIPQLQPHYFSIASSPGAQRDRLAITASVVQHRIAGREETFLGLATNYLLSAQYGSREARVQLHIRLSTFRLPDDHSVPVVLIRAGSGIAPFRAFAQECAQTAGHGCHIGKLVLFFGCRSPSHDLLYADEWGRYTNYEWFDMEYAFSRGTNDSRVYVQDKVLARQETIRQLCEAGARFYICGSLDMAKGVKAVLDVVLSDVMGAGAAAKLQGEKRLREDVWA